MKRFFFLLIVVLWCAPHSEAAEAKADSLVKAEEHRAQRAMLRSLVLPGWGQFYNGKKWKGSLIATLEVGSMVGYVVRRQQIKDLGTPERNWFMISTIGIVLYSMADAYVDAHLDRVNWGGIQAGVGEDGAAKVVWRVRFK